MARFTKNSKGLYRTGVVIGYDSSGKVIRKWLSARTITELEKKIAEVKAAVESGYALNDNVRFGPYAKKWLETYKVNRSLNTQRMYSYVIERHLSPIFGLRVKEIKPMQLQSLINDSAEFPRTCEQMKITLKQIFKQAMLDGLAHKNPAESLELPRHTKEEKRALTQEEKEALKQADLSEKEKAFMMIAYGCGLRPAEIYALTWQDVDFKNGTIRVNKSLVFGNSNRPLVTPPKTDHSVRIIEAPGMTMNALRAYRGTNILPRLFCATNGEYMSKTGYACFWRRIKKKIEAVLGHETDLTLYHFRHNYCTELYYSGVSLKEAQRLMGHASYEMIMKTYAHLDSTKEDTRSKIDAIAF